MPVLTVAAVLLGAACGQAQSPLPEAAARLLAEPRFKHAHWGMLVVDAVTGEVVHDVNADRLFVPASVTKCFSVACALDELGADHRFKTPVFRRGTLMDGELTGDLILRASGDLTMGGRTLPDGSIDFRDSDHTYAGGGTETQLTAPDPLAGLNELARQVAASGLRRVRGEVLIDDRLFDRAESSGSGPRAVSPILINDNVLDIVITPSEAGHPAKLEWRPATRAVRVENRVETVSKDGPLKTAVRDFGHGRIEVTGTIPQDHKPVTQVREVSDAASFARSLFIEALSRAGVQMEASPLADHPPVTTWPSKEEYAQLCQVAELTSPPFSENARLILKVSHNLHASTLPLLVAARHGERTLEQGLRREGAFFQRIGMEGETISFGGGAGGSRADYVTPRATVSLLRHMATRPDADVYRAALPRMGVDGTLARVVGPSSPVRDRVQAKTGTLYWDNALHGSELLTSKALAGYMTTAKGRSLCLALFVNMVHLRDGVDTKSIGKDLGRMCEILHEAH